CALPICTMRHSQLPVMVCCARAHVPKTPRILPQKTITGSWLWRIVRRRAAGQALARDAWSRRVRAPAAGRIVEMTGSLVEPALLVAADLLPRGASVLAACSGGPDSVALA